MRKGIRNNQLEIQNDRRFLEAEVDEAIFSQAVDRIAERMKKNLARFKGHFPGDESKGGIYEKLPQVNKGTWGAGYWVGIHWLLYALTKEDIFKETAFDYTSIFEKTLTKSHYDSTHCVGCEADPALVWGYRFTEDSRLKELAVKAGEIMLDRYIPNPGFVHMAGKMDDPHEGRRVIIDSFTVIPILYFASEFSGNPVFAEAAIQNSYTLLRYNIRNNGSIIQLTEFDKRDGKYIQHLPHQGFDLQSTWSRGSGWASWGLPDLYRYTGDEEVFFAAEQVNRFFLNNLPSDLIPYWDLNFTEGNNEPRDSSAAALVSAGLQKLLKVKPDCSNALIYQKANDRLLAQLIKTCWEEDHHIEGLLAHVCANRPRNRNIDEYTTWGDYYFVEALYYRLGGRYF